MPLKMDVNPLLLRARKVLRFVIYPFYMATVEMSQEKRIVGLNGDSTDKNVA